MNSGKIRRRQSRLRRTSMERIEWEVDGIPCQVDVQHHPAIRGARERGSGIQLEPDEPEFYSIITIRDRKGYDAPWLKRKVTQDDKVAERFIIELSQHLEYPIELEF